MALHPEAPSRQLDRPRLLSVFSAEAYSLLAVIAVLWVGNFLYFSAFGFYDDDWYFLGSAFDVPALVTLHSHVSLMFFQGRPLSILLGGLVACAGAGLGSIPALYFITFLFSAAKSILAYFVLRLRFDAALSTAAALLFAISPLTTVRQSLNNELGAAPAFCFAFAAILLYAGRRFTLAYLMAAFVLLTYEPMFLLFAAAPLFRRDGLNRKALMELARHAALCAAALVAAFVLRRYAGESRSAGIAGGPAIVWRLISLDLIYSINSMKSYLYGAYVGALHLTIETAFYTAGVFIPATLVALRRVPEGAESRREERPRLVAGAAMGCILVLLAFALSYFHLGGSSAWPFAGRDTRVASAATFGSSLFVASIFLLLANALASKLARRTVMAVFMLFLSAEFAYSILIQQDYVLAWRRDVSLLNQAVMLTPDAGPDSTLIVDSMRKWQSLFPGEVRAPSIGYEYGLQESLRILTHWAIPVPKIMFPPDVDWAKDLTFGADGMLHWREELFVNWGGHWKEPMVPGRIIWLIESTDGFLIRSDREVIVDGKAVQQKWDRGLEESRWKLFLQRPFVERVIGRLPWYVTAANTQWAKESVNAYGAPIEKVRMGHVTTWDSLATGKAASQSSNYGTVASLAVDGNTNGSFFAGSVTHTYPEPNAWWQVDLGSSTTIKSIVIWNRTDCCQDRLADYWVFVSDVPFGPKDTPATLQSRPGTWSSHQTTTPILSATIRTGGIKGRYVRVQLTGTNPLSLAEVQVF